MDDALLAAIYADPDDDAPRHVLADALIDRGDPRGEFISMQLARGRKDVRIAREWLSSKRQPVRLVARTAGALRVGGIVKRQQALPAVACEAAEPENLLGIGERQQQLIGADVHRDDARQRSHRR